MSHSINIEYISVADLIPYAANSRTYNEMPNDANS